MNVMVGPLTKQDWIVQQQAALYPRTHGPSSPDRYRAIAEWWRLHAALSADPATCLAYSVNQARLADDMATRPQHYNSASRRLSSKTDWQWSGLAEINAASSKAKGRS